MIRLRSGGEWADDGSNRAVVTNMRPLATGTLWHSHGKGIMPALEVVRHEANEAPAQGRESQTESPVAE
jgi:hypothetical protein